MFLEIFLKFEFSFFFCFLFLSILALWSSSWLKDFFS